MPIIPGRPKGPPTSDTGAPRNVGCGGIDDLDAKRAPKKGDAGDKEMPENMDRGDAE